VNLTDGRDAVEHDRGDAQEDADNEDDVKGFSGDGFGFENDFLKFFAPGFPMFMLSFELIRGLVHRLPPGRQIFFPGPDVAPYMMISSV
jgi:hypothetical protein